MQLAPKLERDKLGHRIIDDGIDRQVGLNAMLLELEEEVAPANAHFFGQDADGDRRTRVRAGSGAV